METIKGQDLVREKMKDIVYVRMTDTMINELRGIRKTTGIPVSEIIRESVKRTLIEANETGCLTFKIE